VKVKGQFGDGGDGRVNRPPGVGEGMADQRREQMLQAALEVIVERGYADTRIADVPIALEDPQVAPARAFELSMQYASGELGFPWSRRRPQLSRS